MKPTYLVQNLLTKTKQAYSYKLSSRKNTHRKRKQQTKTEQTDATEYQALSQMSFKKIPMSELQVNLQPFFSP